VPGFAPERQLCVTKCTAITGEGLSPVPPSVQQLPDA